MTKRREAVSHHLMYLLPVLLHPGRATYYGNDGGATIHQGSCLFG
jgi:hypothetical protein